MKIQTEIFNAEVLFRGLENEGSSYIPRVKLFKSRSVCLNGNWSAEKIENYCRAIAKKQGITNGEINLTVIKDFDEEVDLVFNI